MGSSENAKCRARSDSPPRGDIAEPAVQDKESHAHGHQRTVRRLMHRWARTTTFMVMNFADSFDCIIKLLGPMFMCIAFALFGFVSYSFFTVVLPATRLPYTAKVMEGQLALFLLGNMIYNYLRAIFTDPGLPPEYEMLDAESLCADMTGDKDGEEDGVKAALKPRKCPKCSRQKPDRCHHCSICRRCVLKMDHHCPWVNNCVGHGNYRYFCLFMLFLAFCCLFVAISSCNLFISSMFRPRRSKLSFSDRQFISLSFIIAVCILIALFLLGGFHIYLVLTNQTTIEFHDNMRKKREGRASGKGYRNPWDLGRRRNFQQVFGPNTFCRGRWLLPYMALPPPGNGMQFPTLSSLRV